MIKLNTSFCKQSSLTVTLTVTTKKTIMASVSSLMAPTSFLKPISIPQSPSSFQVLRPTSFHTFASVPLLLNSKTRHIVAAGRALVPVPAVERTLFVGNMPRNITSERLKEIVEEHGAVETAEVMYDRYSKRSRRFGFVIMKTVEDANAATEKLNGTEIEGRVIKVNITDKTYYMAPVKTEEFVDSPYKVYVGNIAKTVTTESLKEFFSEKGDVLSARVSRTPGKSSVFGFVTFSSDEDVEKAISSFNNAELEGQNIRVKKA